MITENRRARAHVDIPLLVLVFGMSLFGVVAVCVATYTPESSSDTSFLNHVVESNYTMRQCLFLLVAPLVIGVLMSLPSDFCAAMRSRFTGLLFCSLPLRQYLTVLRALKPGSIPSGDIRFSLLNLPSCL